MIHVSAAWIISCPRPGAAPRFPPTGLALDEPNGLLAAGGELSAAWLLAGTATAQTEAPAYRFSPVNQYGINLTAAYWNPIIAYVSEKSGVKLQLKIGRTSADTTSYVLAQEVEFVFSNHLFSPEREALGWKVFGRRNAPENRVLHSPACPPRAPPSIAA